MTLPSSPGLTFHSKYYKVWKHHVGVLEIVQSHIDICRHSHGHYCLCRLLWNNPKSQNSWRDRKAAHFGHDFGVCHFSTIFVFSWVFMIERSDVAHFIFSRPRPWGGGRHFLLKFFSSAPTLECVSLLTFYILYLIVKYTIF